MTTPIKPTDNRPFVKHENLDAYAAWIHARFAATRKISYDYDRQCWLVDGRPEGLQLASHSRCYRIWNRFIEYHLSDADAFDSASRYTDGPCPKLERLIRGKWYVFSDTYSGDGCWLNEATQGRLPADE